MIYIALALWPKSALKIKFCKFLFLARFLGSNENSEILLKYPTFERVFFMFLWGKKGVSLHCSACTIKLINIELRKLSILASKYDF